MSWTGNALQKVISYYIPKADFIVCDSFSTEKDILKIFPATYGRTKTIHLGLKKIDNKSIESNSSVLDGSSSPFILHVGSSAWYKNRNIVLETFVKLILNYNHKDLYLILVGNPPTDNKLSLSNIT